MASNSQPHVNGVNGVHATGADNDEMSDLDINRDVANGSVNGVNGVNGAYQHGGLSIVYHVVYEDAMDMATDNQANGDAAMNATVHPSADNGHANHTVNLDDPIADETYDGDVEDSLATPTETDTNETGASDVSETLVFEGGGIIDVELLEDEQDKSDINIEDYMYREQCIFCMVEDPTEGIVFVDFHLTCEHKACRECFNKAAETSMASRYTYPLTCPCHQYTELQLEIDLDSFKEFLDPPNQTRLARCQREYWVRNPTWCFTPDCATMLRDLAEPWRVQFLACPHCNEHTCTKCKAPKSAHPGPGVCPDLLSAEDRALMEAKGWKQCPNEWCRTVIERLPAGCSLMMACQCGTRFCWKCLARINASWVSYHCGCRDDEGGDGDTRPTPEQEASKTYQNDPRCMW